MVQYNQSYAEKEILLNDQLIDDHTIIILLMTSFILVVLLSASASLAFRLRCFTLNFVFVLSLSVRHTFFTLYTFIDR